MLSHRVWTLVSSKDLLKVLQGKGSMCIVRIIREKVSMSFHLPRASI